ncbi:protein kinase domain-containing protein [Ruicaihuangia caeni]|uniref:Protein kinase domain-containing protein n=1 Tax=Ruicaihuangia caeni TaxID=3042517 RepID=A0AAW6T7N2_9MICO|nr:hypothetical protein [Klugiella sp. YN-L-19]MDI2098110.1 hypothetical protein [Klugiella sp. YN-L-19]
MLQEGAVINLPRTGGAWRLGPLIGEGGQGSVHRLDPLPAAHGDYTVDDADGTAGAASEPLALKWYHDRAATPRQRDAIERLITRGAPGLMFLWPLELVTHPDAGGFGYVMPLRDEHFRPVGDLLLGRVGAPPRLSLALCTGLAHAFLLLHVEGLCYRDISFGNVFFDPTTGDALVCDNDNVGVDGASYTAVLGTRRFMAPEVIRGDALPSAQSDLHSLAVLLFFILARHHPLIGGLESEHRGRDGELDLLGRHPLFIFDPADERNRPDPATQPAPLARWQRLPESIKALFTQTFTAGLHDPSRRVRESVWRAALTRLRDGLHECGWCGEQHLSDAGAVSRCASCRRPLDAPVRLLGERSSITLNQGTQLTRHHIARDYDLATAVGVVVHDEERGMWGLRHVGDDPWRLERIGHAPLVVRPGQTVALIEGAQLIVGRSRFVISTDAG